MIYGQYGVGLLRLELIKKEEALLIKNKEDKDMEVIASLPHWWPEDGHSFVWNALSDEDAGRNFNQICLAKNDELLENLIDLLYFIRILCH